jgi:hypothetical protein
MDDLGVWVSRVSRIAMPMPPPSMRISALRPPSDAILDAAIAVLKTLSDPRTLPAPFAG